MLLCVCSVMDHRGCQHVARTSGIALSTTFLFLPHFDVIHDLLLNRCTATWNIFVKQKHQSACVLSSHYFLNKKPKMFYLML